MPLSTRPTSATLRSICRGAWPITAYLSEPSLSGASVVRFAIPSPGGPLEGVAIALSPDGRGMAIATGQPGLYLRDLDQPGARLLEGTAGAANPFFSPDGEWVGFFAGGRLKKVAIAGGAPVTVCDVPADRGGSWSADGTIVVATSNTPLMQVSASGGRPRPLALSLVCPFPMRL